MQKNKLNLHICGIHLLNPYKTVVSHLNMIFFGWYNKINTVHILSCFSGISSSLVALQGDLVAHCPLVGALGNDCFSCFSSSSRERYPPNSRLKKLKKMVEHGFNKESASVHSVKTSSVYTHFPYCFSICVKNNFINVISQPSVGGIVSFAAVFRDVTCDISKAECRWKNTATNLIIRKFRLKYWKRFSYLKFLSKCINMDNYLLGINEFLSMSSSLLKKMFCCKNLSHFCR